MRRLDRSSVLSFLLLLAAASACGDLIDPVAEPDLGPETTYTASTSLSSGAPITGTILFSALAVNGITEDGLITGFKNASGRREAYLWDDGAIEFLGVLDEAVTNPFSHGFDANDLGQVVGVSSVSIPTGGIRREAFSWSSGTMTSLPDPVTDRDIRGSLAWAVNSSGDIVGNVTYPRGKQAVLWPAGGSPVLLPSLGDPTDPNSDAVDINDRGQVVGWSRNVDGRIEATVWEAGVPRGLGVLGGISSQAEGINDQGDVVGNRAGEVVFWPADGPPVVLGLPGFVDLSGSSVFISGTAQDINDEQQIIGYEIGVDFDFFGFQSETRGFSWQAGEFVELAAPGQESFSEVETRPVAINDAGEAVGRADTPDGFQVVLWEIKAGITVAIDIKPGSDPNSVLCERPEEVIPVAILSTRTAAGETLDFDAITVDHATVAFQGAGEAHVNPSTGDPIRHEQDVDADGDLDLVLHFRYGDTDLTCSSTGGTLTGETFDGTPITGTDAVRMIGAPQGLQ